MNPFDAHFIMHVAAPVFLGAISALVAIMPDVA